MTTKVISITPETATALRDLIHGKRPKLTRRSKAGNENCENGGRT